MSELPSDWGFETLGKSCKVQGGFAFKSGDYTKNGTGIPVIKIGDLQNGRVHVGEKSTRVPEEFLQNERLSKFLLQDGDILIAMTGATTGKIGKYDSASSGTAYLNQRVGRFLVDGQSLQQEFIQFLAQTDVFQQRIQENILAAAQGNISPKKLEGIPVPLPPFPEQKKIAHILSTVQRAIKAQERIIQTTTELKKALMHKLFTEGLRSGPQKQTEVGPVPDSWEESTLGELTIMHTGGTPSRKNKDYWEGGKIPWVKTGEINYCEITGTEESITEAGLKGSNAKLFPKGTLLMAMYGQGITRGRVGLLGIDATTNQACVAIIPHDEAQVTTDYLYFYLEYCYEELRSRGHGANQKNLSMTLLKLFPVTFPASEDQEAIVTALKATDVKISLAESQRTAFQSLFRTLLHELMTAKTRVHDF